MISRYKYSSPTNSIPACGPTDTSPGCSYLSSGRYSGGASKQAGNVSVGSTVKTRAGAVSQTAASTSGLRVAGFAYDTTKWPEGASHKVSPRCHSRKSTDELLRPTHPWIVRLSRTTRQPRTQSKRMSCREDRRREAASPLGARKRRFRQLQIVLNFLCPMSIGSKSPMHSSRLLEKEFVAVRPVIFIQG